MKLWLAIVAFVATISVWEVNANYYLFRNLEKYDSFSQDNDMLDSANETGPVAPASSRIKFKQEIDKDTNPLMLSATITNTDTNKSVYDGGPFNICEDQGKGGWGDVLVKIFNRFMIPQRRRNVRCPVKPQTVEMNNLAPVFGTDLNDPLDMGSYNIKFTAETSDQQPVFSSLDFRFDVSDPPQKSDNK